MTRASPSSPRPLAPADVPAVRLEVRLGSNTTSYAVNDAGFLLGSVPGCDLRLPGANLPPVLALIARQPGGVTLRKLAPIGGLLLNGEAVTHAPLNDGDRLTAGAVGILVSVKPAGVPVMRVQLYTGSADQETGGREQDAQARDQQAELAALRHELNERAAQLTKQQEEFEAVRREFAQMRQQVYERYRHRRDRLVGLREAVRRGARKVQERKRQFEAEARQSADLAETERAFQEREQRLREQEEELRRDAGRKLADVAARERRLEEEREALRKGQGQHQSDLARLDRLAATLEQRQKQLQRHALAVDRRYEQLQRDTRELAEQAGQLDEWHTRVTRESEGLARQKEELESARSELARRAAELEGQQTMLASLRTRLERLREEHRRQEQALAEQRASQDVAEQETQERLAGACRLSEELEAEKKLREQEQRQFEERRDTLEAAVAQLRQARDELTRETEHLRQRERELGTAVSDQQEQAALLQARGLQLDELQQRLDADRKALGEREASLTQSEKSLAALQEQLRRRSEELVARQREQTEQVQQLQEARANLDTRREEIETQRRQGEEELVRGRAGVDGQAAQLGEARAELAQREEALRREADELSEARQKIDADRAALEAARARLESDRQGAASALEQAKADCEAARVEADSLARHLPELEQKAEAALERLAQTREQLRGHLAEVHDFTRQSRDDIDALRAAARDEAEQLQQREQSLHRRQDEHRLAAAAFRQQLIDWQAQISELRQSLVRGEGRLERRQAEVERQAQQLLSTSHQLARQAEDLEQRQRQVAERRGEIDRHLADMREWYRRKLRELARVDELPAAADDEEVPLSEARPNILALTGEVDPGDRRLGDLLRSLELVDADTLNALLVEARRQRRSLRQLLLAGSYLTLYQIALIEAGNVGGLVLGPVRVIDRLQATAHEAVYRVFDPRGNREVLLRHLAEVEMHDAVRPDEFRQRFAAAAAVRHANIAITYEALEIAGRPAVLQEWLSGLPGGDWPALSAAPGVWFRLLSQAALGLHVAHQAGLVHGNLHGGQFVVTAEGVLKVCGLGEPPWLAVPPPADPDRADVAGDLLALGRCARAWCAPSGEGGGSRPKPLPPPLQAVLHRLSGEDGAEPFAGAADLLDELDRAGTAVPPNAATWERFVRQVREQSADSPLRRSA